MFSNILIPTDGAPLSDAAVKRGVELAKHMNAKVTCLHVAEPFRVLGTESEVLKDTREEYYACAWANAEEVLAAFEEDAIAAGVANVERVFLVCEHPYEAIIDTARDKACDLIVMASHGRRGLQALLLGSETHKVLVHSKIPVLVYR